MSTIKPITPQEAELQEGSQIPDAVIGIFNKLIVKNLHNGQAKITITEVEQAILAEVQSHIALPSNYTINHDWLDVEPIFRRAGWKVTYDKPAYFETYEGYYIFTVK